MNRLLRTYAFICLFMYLFLIYVYIKIKQFILIWLGITMQLLGLPQRESMHPLLISSQISDHSEVSQRAWLEHSPDAKHFCP